MATSATRMTSEQYLARAEEFDANGDLIKDELIAGEIVPMAHTSKKHDYVKGKIGKALTIFLYAHRELKLEVYQEIACRVAEADTFVPDVIAIEERRMLDGNWKIIQGAADLVVEVISPSDEAEKVRVKISAYLANGARSVWVVYSNLKLMEVHTAQGVREVKNGQTLEDQLLPGFSVPVAQFFEGL